MEYVVVLGSPRSGTTYLKDTIARLRGMDAQAGNLVPVVVPHLVNQDLAPPVYEALCRSFQKEIDTYLAGNYNSRFRALEDWWTAPYQWTRLGHVVRKGGRPHPDTFVYKEPFFSLAPEFVRDALPGAKMIYIYRDGRDVANSLMSTYNVLTDQKLTDLQSTEMPLGRSYDHRHVPWWVEEGREEVFIQSTPYVRAIWMWSYMVERCAAYFDELNSDARSSVLKVSYERFMEHPHELGDQILDHIGAESTRAFRSKLSNARTSSIGKYRRRPDHEIEAAERIARQSLQRLGYL